MRASAIPGALRAVGRLRRTSGTLVLAAFLAACADAPPDSLPALAPAPAPAPAHAPAPEPHTRIDGRNFPDKVIALTWDDGPDAGTLDLASYLERHHISATFFVVASWTPGLSDDPGRGKGVLESGYEYLPILGDLVGLGHRLGNHTLNHVILREAAGAQTVDHQLRENQRRLDPFLTSELRLFRAPGGGWGTFAASIVDGDPYLSRMTGPISWDIDRKDWDESLSCRGSHAAFDCERAGPGGELRMKASSVAARYLSTIESTGHGIVLLHDRVGHVGSTYALDVAQALIPQLEARGFVFAAPVLRFSPLLTRHREADVSDAQRWDDSTLAISDVNGDGRDDLCGRTASREVACAVSVQHTFNSPTLPRAAFRSVKTKAREATPGRLFLAPDELRYGDLNGDGRQDVCEHRRDGSVTCAFSTGRGFTTSTVWLAANATIDFTRGWQLGDVNGDGRADLCGHGPDGIVCGLAP